MTRYTAFVIQNPDNDIRCEIYGQDRESKKFAGAINLYHDGSFHTTLLSSEPTYDSEILAVSAMKDVVEAVKKLDLKVQ